MYWYVHIYENGRVRAINVFDNLDFYKGIKEMFDVPEQTYEEIVNNSITQTLSRSINTSFTTLFMVVALWIFGVESVKEFALPLIAGVVCGAYSSVCITGTLWCFLRKHLPEKAVEEEE